jgi:hypothetical protein
MQNFTLLTLGQLLTHESQTIRRLAGSILKLLQRQTPPKCIQHGCNNPQYETAHVCKKHLNERNAPHMQID